MEQAEMGSNFSYKLVQTPILQLGSTERHRNRVPSRNKIKLLTI